MLILAIVSAVSGFFIWYHGEVKQSGVAACELRHANASDKAEADKIKSLNEQLIMLQEKNRLNDAELKKARKLIGEYQMTRRNIDEEISRLSTESGSCSKLGPDFLRLFNDSIGIKPII